MEKAVNETGRASPEALQNCRQDYQSCEACAAILSKRGAVSPASIRGEASFAESNPAD